MAGLRGRIEHRERAAWTARNGGLRARFLTPEIAEAALPLPDPVPIRVQALADAVVHAERMAARGKADIAAATARLMEVQKRQTSLNDDVTKANRRLNEAHGVVNEMRAEAMRIARSKATR
jgi:hypothetical protein